MATAAALRLAARKIQPRFSAAASAVLKEKQRVLLQPRISSRGGSSLRRFSSSETPNLLNKNKQELLGPLRQTEGESSTRNECQELIRLLQNPDNMTLVKFTCSLLGGSMFLGSATSLVGIMVYQHVFGR